MSLMLVSSIETATQGVSLLTLYWCFGYGPNAGVKESVRSEIGSELLYWCTEMYRKRGLWHLARVAPRLYQFN
jgi:hypothetical protein